MNPNKHPKGLYVLCAAEASERFGFYLLAALLLLWLNESLGWSGSSAMSLGGWYKFWVYLTPFAGGVLADKYLGYRRAIVIGTILLGLGYALLGWAHHGTWILYAAILVLVLGNGLFKPNISTLVGNLYAQGDPRRDDAFSRFYMGINLGALFAPIVGESVRLNYGFTAAFMCAAAGMGLSTVILLAYRGALAAADTHSSVAAIVGVPLDIEDPSDPPEVERARILALAIMAGIMLVFWMSFYQNDNALVLFARDNTDRVITIPNLGFWSANLSLLWHGHAAAHPWWRSWEIPPGVFNSVNPGFILLLTAPLGWFLSKFLRRLGLEPSTPAKIAIGMILTAVSYLIMVVACLRLDSANHGLVSVWWIVACYFVITVAELFVSPMGLSMVTKLAPRRMTARMMGLWFLSTAIGGWLAGKLGSWFWETWSHSKFFGIFAVASLAAAAALLTQYKRLAAAIPPESHEGEIASEIDDHGPAIPDTELDLAAS